MHTDTATQTYTETRRRATGAKNVSPQTLIQQAFDDADGDKSEAVESILALLLTGHTLHDHLLRRGAVTAIGELVRNDNAKIRTGNPAADVTVSRPYLVMPKSADPGAAARRARGAAQRETRMFLEYRLPNGKKLGKANEADLEHAITFHRTQGATMFADAAWYSRIRLGLKGKIVEQVYSDADLTEMHATSRMQEAKTNAA